MKLPNYLRFQAAPRTATGQGRDRGSISNFALMDHPGTLCWGENILLCSYSLAGTGCFWPWFSKGVHLHGCTVAVWKPPPNSIWAARLVSTELEGRVEISKSHSKKLGLSRTVQRSLVPCVLPKSWAATGQFISSLKTCCLLPGQPLAEGWS